MPSFAAAIAQSLSRNGVDLAALGLAWVRVLPTVVLVPAFGLRALPGPARAVASLALAASIFPAVGAATSAAAPPWPLLLAVEALRGLPVALAAAVPLWAATMAGGVADALRGSQDAPIAPTVEGRATTLGVPFSLLACALFLATGGPARAAAALALRPTPESPLLASSRDLLAGITLAVALAAPLLAASVIVEIAGALVARAAAPAQVHSLLAPVRALAILAVLALVFERVASGLALAVQAAP